jgi:hypothetical protein
MIAEDIALSTVDHTHTYTCMQAATIPSKRTADSMATAADVAQKKLKAAGVPEVTPDIPLPPVSHSHTNVYVHVHA